MSASKPMILSDKPGVQTLVFAAHDFGVKHVFICPGSRNAPITISFHRSGLFTCHSIADERVAGFYALGVALATGAPVAVICTSGSAGINIAPSLAEAYYLRAPVIAITADRPLAWTDQGNGQTVNQEGMYANFIRYQFSLIGEPVNETEMWVNRRKLADAFNTALVNDPGPVHINLPLAEPLYNTCEFVETDETRFFKKVPIQRTIQGNALDALASVFAASQKVMILAGQMAPNEKLDKVLENLASLSNTVVLMETTSNLHNTEAISTIDRLVMPLGDHEILKSLMPDLLITVGGMVVSKKIKALIRAHKPAHHWHIHSTDEGLDTYMHLTHEINAAPEDFLENLVPAIRDTKNSTYRSLWMDLKAAAQKGHDSYLNGIDFSDFKAFEILDQFLPSDITLHMANSSPVRYFQLFGMRNHTYYHANRGTSGIDGSTSTAAGWALAKPEQDHVLVTGDVAFLYDSNALWNHSFPRNLKIVVINNGGGGIFRIIDGAEKVDELEAFFEAHHPVGIASLTKAYGLEHFLATDEDGLKAAMETFNGHQGPCILEIRTPTKKNAPILKAYFKQINKEYRDSGLI